MTYFISGHRDITEEDFDLYYKNKIYTIIYMDSDASFVVGDYYGVDFMAQKFIVDLGFTDKLTVFHMFDKPRNLYSDEIKTVGGFKTDEERDACMTRLSDFDIAYYNHEPSGTSDNIRRRHDMNYKPNM